MQESNISICSSHLSRGNALDSIQPVGIMLLKCYSKMLIDDLVESGEDFQNIDLLIDPEFWNSVENVCKGNRMTPITIYEDGSHLVGYNGVASKF